MTLSPQAGLMTVSALLFLMLATVTSTPVRPTVWALILLVFATAYLLRHREARALAGLDLAVVLALLSYLFTSVPHMIREPNVSYYTAGPLGMAAAVPVYLVLRHALQDPARLRTALEWGLAAGAVGTLAVALYQYFWLGHPRVTNFLMVINLGFVNVAMLFLALGLMRGSAYRPLLAVAMVAMTLIALLNATRGSLVVIPLLLVAWVLLNRDRVSLRSLGVGALAFVVLAGLAYSAIPALQDRVAQSVDEARFIARGDLESPISSGDRLGLWIAAGHAFLENPLTGLMRSQREEQIGDLVDAGVVHSRVAVFTGGHAHNHYFEMLASTGILGLVGILAYMVFPAVLFLWRYRRDRSDGFALAGLLFVAAFMVSSMTEVPLKKDYIAFFYGSLVAALLALSLVHRGSGQARTAVAGDASGGPR
ncbi:O-antigen polymerase [Thioalkalivibrio nitratireducens DSM 14787]|uniref:O-antigen polymerase n=1 Tax=Thioalkalivibrio nitratireducens (strain DSM 14787 / UNIQEM 213 / ALEN2) TaxID=1255043 RepID=L0E059_THIND|nr:O-antigen ligase family protein [Thioalkalivibrio nitratireducens]AGA34683.1 O-antigen polymerase [Thioalkalivibrio nitratireducens DSM 14787]